MDWPILIVWLNGRADSQLLEMLSSKGWALESVASLQETLHRASRAEYLAIVIQVSQAPAPEQLEGLLRLRKLQPLAPVFLLGRAELDAPQILTKLGLNSTSWLQSTGQLHQALSDVLNAECDQGLADTVILCVDDDPEFLLSMQQWLEPRLAECFGDRGRPQLEFASSPAQALEFAAQISRQALDGPRHAQSPAQDQSEQYGQARQLGLVLTDQKMPKTSGTELLTQIKAMVPKARRALLTGHAGLDSAVTAINKQLVDRYFTKPITDHVDFANGIVHLLNEYLLGERQEWYIARLRAQYEFARDLSTQAGLSDVLDLTVRFIAENLRCRRVSIMLIEDNCLVVKAHCGLPEQLDVENIRIPIGRGVAGNVFQSGLPNYHNDRNPNYWQEDDSPVESSFRVFASVPLMLAPLRVHDMPLGVINVTERMDDKPFTRDEAALLAYIADTVSIAINNQLNRREVENLYYQTITSLALAMESKDPYTAGHSQRVHEYSVGIARQLGLSAEDVEQIGRAALLHDLGKIGVPEHIVDKPGPMTEDEFQQMARHPSEGARIIQALSFLKHLAPIVRSHHERLDGQGYPDHIKAEDIPLAARIIAVADTVDAMTSDRPYRKALPAEDMLAELEKVSGSHLDVQCVQAFIAFWNDRQEEKAHPEALAQASTD